MTEPLALKWLGLALSEKQISQVVENLESGGKPKKFGDRRNRSISLADTLRCGKFGWS
ncbi:MAG: hypothetical protein IT170_15505 [Bryobacterales bacterium]|nr:hypothetical protein [Bryobacterales bacterium]